jgi:hypothetical protein
VQDDKALYHYRKAYEYYLEYKETPWAEELDNAYVEGLKKELKYSEFWMWLPLTTLQFLVIASYFYSMESIFWTLEFHLG